MTSNEFKTTRILRLKVNQRELATLMATPLRTIQDIEAQGDSDIRGVYAVCIRLLAERHQWVMQAVIESVDAKIARAYPNGIPGATVNED
jgi:hypothetical protein